MEKLEIRRVKSGELEDCAAVIRKGFGTVACEFGLTRQNCPTNGAFIEAEKLYADMEKGKLMYGAFVGDRMVGFMQLEQKSTTQYELEKITVLPEYRHCGIGQTLLLFAKKKAAEQGGQTLTIGMIEENTRLKNWYLRQGFVHLGTLQIPSLPFTVGKMEMELTSD